MPAAVQAVEQRHAAAGLQGDEESFLQVHRGILGAARLQIEHRHLMQQPRLGRQIAHIPGSGQPGSAYPLGSAEVPP